MVRFSIYVEMGAMRYADSGWDTGGPAGHLYFFTAIKPKLGRNIIMAENCENCGRGIGELEMPCVFNGLVVCFDCDGLLRRQATVC